MLAGGREQQARDSSSDCERLRRAMRDERRKDLRSEIGAGVMGVAGGVESLVADGAAEGEAGAPRNALPLARSQTLQRWSTICC